MLNASTCREPPAVAGIMPGQFWRIEVAPQGTPSEKMRRALAEANVVIYDRALAPLVAALLPLGGYAEPAPTRDGAADPAADRCTSFARDGWSVLRLAVGATLQDRLTVLMDPVGGVGAARLYAVAANGLAG